MTVWEGTEVWALQLPGHGTRLCERPFRTLDPLIEELGTVVLPLLNKPFALFGHSLGALLGFELARSLRRRYGILPVRLVVSAHPSPAIPRPEDAIHQLSDVGLIHRLRELGGTPEAVFAHPELRDIFLPILRADLAMCETYRYRPERPLDCPISVYGGSADASVNLPDLKGWQDLTSAGFSLRLIPGDHFYFRTARTLLLQAMAQELGPVAAVASPAEPPFRQENFDYV